MSIIFITGPELKLLPVSDAVSLVTGDASAGYENSPFMHKGSYLILVVIKAYDLEILIFRLNIPAEI
jgi:hypothetical protein